jgi:hypothetical protein
VAYSDLLTVPPNTITGNPTPPNTDACSPSTPPRYPHIPILTAAEQAIVGSSAAAGRP